MTKHTQATIQTPIKSLSAIGRELEQTNISPELLADFKRAEFAISCAHSTVNKVECAFSALTQLFDHAVADSISVLEIDQLLKPQFDLLSNASEELGGAI